MDDVFDPYKTLQVDPEADPDVIQAAYRRLASKFHPDRGGGREADLRMVALNRAWEILSDPGRRTAFDVERSARAAPASGSVAGDPAGGGIARERAPDAAGRVGAEVTGATFTSGRSSVGSGYDAATMRSPDGTAAAGPPPGNPSGPVLNFGRYAGWSLGEIARRDVEYLEWLDRTPIGRPYRESIDGLLRRAGRRTPQAEAGDRRGLFRRR